ncbi:MFS transporter [Desulfovibrio sp. OttesenSCG-928-O18]|nr:MFS transporter [Desulfovibrio sp. OttesenSCG-928-O18]
MTQTENGIGADVDHRRKPGNDGVLRGGKRATRLAFFIAGFGLACWAPLIPFAQERLEADPATLGTILLCLGLGAVIGMPASGALSGRIGSKPVILCGAIGLIVSVPLLAVLSNVFALGACLLLFGASIGAIDVAANIHGTEVQKAAAVPLMSGFHGMYSIGGLAGASGMTMAVAAGLNIVVAAFLAAGIILVCLLFAAPGFIPTREAEAQPLFVMPKGRVLVIGLLALVIFLGEGAMLDWSALLLTQVKQVDVRVSGAGYAVFSLAMVASRFVGDRIVFHAGERATLLAGLAFTGLGIALSAFAGPFAIVLMGMAVAGFAAGNIVPVLFTLAGRQRVMPASHAIAATSILGYTGVLLGPALIGYAANFIGLRIAFYALAVLLLAAMAAIPAIVPSGRGSESS